jgi:hypothetical protein
MAATRTKKTAAHAELNAAAFDEALRLTRDPTRAATLAAAAVRSILIESGDLRTMRMLASGG